MAGMDQLALDADIPDRLYFPIREAARIIAVEPYVLRFWEKEFPMFHPLKGPSGHRKYRKKDIEMALEIKRLLYRQGFTIEGARNQLRKMRTSSALKSAADRVKQSSLPFAEPPKSVLNRIHRELTEILTIMDKRD